MIRLTARNGGNAQPVSARFALWQELKALSTALSDQACRRLQANEGSIRALYFEIGELEKRAKALVPWKVVCKLDRSPQRDPEEGMTLFWSVLALAVFAGVFAWIGIGKLTGNYLIGFFVGLATLLAFPYALSLQLDAWELGKKQADTHVYVPHATSFDADEKYPFTVGYLQRFGDSEIALGRESFCRMELAGNGTTIVLHRKNGEFVGVFTADKDGGRYFSGTSDASERLPVGKLRKDLFDLGEQAKQLHQRFLVLQRNDCSDEPMIDFQKLTIAWENIVLAPDVERDILRSIIHFAYGHEAAPRGLLLQGPPGVGKSLVVDAIGAFYPTTMFRLSVASLKGEHVGASGANVRRLWQEAREKAPAILFIDECEGVFSRRGSDHSDEFSTELLQVFLTEWDGIGRNSRVLVIGATNRPDLLDDAIVSRFSDQYTLLPPGDARRVDLVLAIARQLNLHGGFPEAAVAMMGGMSGRDVRNTIQQAMRLASPAMPEANHYAQAVAKIRNKTSTTTDDTANWQSLVLSAELKRTLQTLVEATRHAEALAAKGIMFPATILFYGPPGTGKTQIARTIANEAGVTFTALSTAELKGMYLGHAANRVAQAFERARSQSPAIMFIDEIDAIGSARDGGDSDSLSMEALTQLLQELDGVAARPGHVTVMAATNRLEAMDGALLSRFSRTISVPLPGESERLDILRVLVQGRPIDGDVDLPELARRTTGFAGRQLRELVKGAFQIAMERSVAEAVPIQHTRLNQKDLLVSFANQSAHAAELATQVM